jgi:tripartite-type tricarboxylate transporter receptor subunit TctC
MNSDSSVGWNAIVPPEVPADRVAVLRSAFDATLHDPEFLADAQKQGLEIVPGRGDEVLQVVEHTLATPPELVARIAAIIGGQN